MVDNLTMELGRTDLVREDGELERYLPDIWTVPAVVESQGDWLVWRELGIDGEHPGTVSPGARMLEDFALLARSDSKSGSEWLQRQTKEVLKYARRWGVLGICEHGLPFSHNPKRWLSRFFQIPFCTPVAREDDESTVRVDASAPVSVVNGDNGRFTFTLHKAHQEPLAAWRKFAVQAHSMLRVAEHLYHSRAVPDEFWESLQDLVPQHRQYSWKYGSESAKLAIAVQAWLALGNVRTHFAWMGKKIRIGTRLTTAVSDSGHFKLFIGGDGLFGALASQLAFAIGRVQVLAFCSACGNPYVPTRKPQIGRRNFCPECGKTVANRLAARDSRRRRNKPEKLPTMR